ncbi:AraC family transcriptional regulator [Streptomyces sp. NPDC005760]|uniref:AraC family transcriptional regulator n=1 Tax=Streptomyces sp. NPDC005760 TaxID=3156718 RepID=UPI0033F7E420
MDKVRQIRLAKDAMDRDWADPGLDLVAVAAHAGYSRYHFLRAFKETYGETPGQYLTHRRIERAEEMLRGAALIPGCYAMLWAGGFPTARATARGPVKTAASNTRKTATSKKRPTPAPAYRDGQEPPDDRRAEP